MCLYVQLLTLLLVAIIFRSIRTSDGILVGPVDPGLIRQRSIDHGNSTLLGQLSLVDLISLTEGKLDLRDCVIKILFEPYTT